MQAQGDLHPAAEAALRVLGVADPNAILKAPTSFEATVRAPISGQVVEQDVASGQLIQPGTTQCFVISDTSTVWVSVNVYQKDLPYVRVGDAVDIQTESYPSVFTVGSPTRRPRWIQPRARYRLASRPPTRVRS